MPPTPKPIPHKNRKGLLIKNLAHIANGIGQTLQVFYPVFLMTGNRFSFLIHQLTDLTPPNAALGYFILSMSSISALFHVLLGAQ